MRSWTSEQYRISGIARAVYSVVNRSNKKNRCEEDLWRNAFSLALPTAKIQGIHTLAPTCQRQSRTRSTKALYRQF